jgi:DNA-binding CsgD family transcriptional regulator
MLVGREQERLALDRLLAEAREGASGVLVLVGEPGIGKTALLEHAAERARGMRVLRARGIESEAEVPFAGLAELLRPALAALDRIPAPQASALAGALALGPASKRDRFAVGAATLSLLTAFAEEEPLALLIDDAHVLDGSSAEALLFAARRLLADPIAVLITARKGEPSLLDGAGLRVIHLGGLDRASAAALLGGQLAAEAVQRMHLATAGNPLALLELAPEAERLAALPEGAPVPLSARITAAFSRRFVQLPSDSRRALLLASVSDDGDLALLVAAGLDPDALRPAEEAGLVSLEEGRVQFVHPLARSAVYAAARPSERRAAHGAIAAVLPDRDVDRRAWHLAAASVGPNAQAASALEHAGERALERSAFSVASSAFERGARLAAGEGVRSRMLLEAAEAAWLAGASRRTLELAEAARARNLEPRLAARIDELRGHVAMRLGPVMDGYALAVAAAENVAAAEPEQAVLLLAEAAHACFYAGATEEMVSAGERAVALSQQAGSRRAAFFGSMARGMAYVAAGRGDQGAVDIRAAIAILEHSDELQDDPRLLAWGAFGPMYLREDGGRELIDRAFDRAREQAAVGALPLLLAYLARDQATSDQWHAAEVSFDEAIRLGRETGQRTELVVALAGLAQLEARQGREISCRAHAAEAAELCEELGMPYHRAWTLQALGDLELALGRPEAAVPHYEAQAGLLERSGIADVDVQPAPELVECKLRLGRPEEAASRAERFIAHAEAKGQPWALARAWRCRGLLALEAGELEDAFERALALHARTPDGFESARTRLAYGARLRRGRQRVRAREQLRTAMASFESLGAPAWADQAAAELAASGEKARRRDVSTLDELTPQELQIATLVGNGKTTREAAAAIFLSPKTVEYHLGHVYRKLNIHSREELAQTFSSSTSDGVE